MPKRKRILDSFLYFCLYIRTDASIQHIIEPTAKKIKFVQVISYSLFQRLLKILSLRISSLFLYIQVLAMGHKLVQSLNRLRVCPYYCRSRIGISSNCLLSLGDLLLYLLEDVLHLLCKHRHLRYRILFLIWQMNV